MGFPYRGNIFTKLHLVDKKSMELELEIMNLGNVRIEPKSDSESLVFRTRQAILPRSKHKRFSMQSIRRCVASGHQNPNIWTGIRSLSTSDAASLVKIVGSLLDSLALKPGGTLVQNCGDSEVGKIVIQLAKERKFQTISILDDKPGTPEIIEELKALGGDIVVPESYTKTWYMKRLTSELSPTAGLNFSDGYQATAVCKAVVDGGTFLTYGKKLPKNVVYDGAVRKPVEWSAFVKEKKLKVLNL